MLWFQANDLDFQEGSFSSESNGENDLLIRSTRLSSQVALSMVTTRHTLPPSSSSGATNVYDQVKSFECCIIENVNVFRLLEAVVAI